MTPSSAGIGINQKHGMTLTKLYTMLAMLIPLLRCGCSGCCGCCGCDGPAPYSGNGGGGGGGGGGVLIAKQYRRRQDPPWILTSLRHHRATRYGRFPPTQATMLVCVAGSYEMTAHLHGFAALAGLTLNAPPTETVSTAAAKIRRIFIAVPPGGPKACRTGGSVRGQRGRAEVPRAIGHWS